jgi:hypothetical protein
VLIILKLNILRQFKNEYIEKFFVIHVPYIVCYFNYCKHQMYNYIMKVYITLNSFV